MLYVVVPRASFIQQNQDLRILRVCYLCFGSYTLFWEYDPPSILFCDANGVRLQIAMGDQAPAGLAIQQLWK